MTIIDASKPEATFFTATSHSQAASFFARRFSSSAQSCRNPYPAASRSLFPQNGMIYSARWS
jgi:hypothetical protein